jgi:hypothetical protein
MIPHDAIDDVIDGQEVDIGIDIVKIGGTSAWLKVCVWIAVVPHDIFDGHEETSSQWDTALFEFATEPQRRSGSTDTTLLSILPYYT